MRNIYTHTCTIICVFTILQWDSENKLDGVQVSCVQKGMRQPVDFKILED